MVGFQTVSIQQELNFSDVLILWDSGLNRTAAAERWRNAYEFSIKDIVIYNFITVHLVHKLFKTYSALHNKILLSLPPLLSLHFKVFWINILGKHNREFSLEIFQSL